MLIDIRYNPEVARRCDRRFGCKRSEDMERVPALTWSIGYSHQFEVSCELILIGHKVNC